MKTFSSPRSAKSILVEQSPVWKNWEPVKNIGPANLGDAPVMLSLGPDNYWMFGRYRKAKKLRSGKEFEPKPAKLKGFDMPLVTTRWKKQFDAPGGLNNTEKGYHAWQSRDMVNWVHHGQVSEERSRWTTTAEYVDDKLYLYYDYPNDQDPHVYVDDDLFDGKPGRDMGMAFSDPSHGSDCVVIRDLDGKFHLIYEDWSPINAKKRAWDSPLAGHAVSNDGLSDFEILPPAVDLRTTPTGKIKTFKHPHWAKEDPANYPTPVAEYEVHTPEQEAFGDWAAISIGGQYYLFGDFDAHEGGTMSVAWFTSSSLDEPFVKCDNIGEGHPDPDVCFAEGQFYLATQQNTDFVSPGPWVDGVEVRVGVDTDGDDTIDQCERKLRPRAGLCQAGLQDARVAGPVGPARGRGLPLRGQAGRHHQERLQADLGPCRTDVLSRGQRPNDYRSGLAPTAENPPSGKAALRVRSINPHGVDRASWVAEL